MGVCNHGLDAGDKKIAFVNIDARFSVFGLLLIIHRQGTVLSRGFEGIFQALLEYGAESKEKVVSSRILLQIIYTYVLISRKACQQFC